MLMTGRLSNIKIVPTLFVSKVLVWFIKLSFISVRITINLLCRHHNDYI